MSYFAEESFKRLSTDPGLPPSSPTYARTSTKLHLSPDSSRKYTPLAHPEMKFPIKLSSPSLVGRNAVSDTVVIPTRTESPNRSYKAGRESPRRDIKVRRESPSRDHKTGRDSPSRNLKNDRDSPNKNYKTAIDKKLQTKHSSDNIVLRQPKKSEMTYFGVNISPKPLSKKSSPAVIRKQEKLSPEKSEQHFRKPPSPKLKPRRKSPDPAESPIYENLKRKYSRDFDSSILDELTKAADQILQAVNDYEKEETFTRNLTDDDSEAQTKKPLETITETKSWKPEGHGLRTAPQNTKARLRHTSSTSSVDSVTSPRSSQQKATKAAQERQLKKVEKTENAARVNVKARRLQRASSREALLQSHGSSSEDLPTKVEVPVRKPRMVKKTKAMQFSMTNGPELKTPSSSRSTLRKDESSKEERYVDQDLFAVFDYLSFI